MIILLKPAPSKKLDFLTISHNQINSNKSYLYGTNRNPKTVVVHLFLEIGCLPLKVEQKGVMAHVIQTALSFKEEKVEETKFELPVFTKVIAN